MEVLATFFLFVIFSISILVFIGVVFIVLGQDVVMFISRLQEFFSQFSPSYRNEVIMLEKGRLEERIICESMSGTAKVDPSRNTMTATSALEMLNPFPLRASRWTITTEERITQELDAAVREFSQRFRHVLSRLQKSSTARKQTIRVRSLYLMVFVFGTALAVLAYVSTVIHERAIRAVQELAFEHVYLTYFIIMAHGILAVIVKSAHRPIFTAFATFVCCMLTVLVVMKDQQLWVAPFIASLIIFLRSTYAAFRHKLSRKIVNCDAPTPPPTFLVHGDEYFPALSRALQNAKKRIFISGWFLAPEMRLRDGREDDTLISLLQDVKRKNPKLEIYVIVYNEPVLAPLRVGSRFVVAKLEAKQIGAKVLRLPRRLAGSMLNTMWSCHSKVVAIDAGTPQVQAFVGGIDLCFGRYDTADHELLDYKKPYRWPGIDYWCPHACSITDQDLLHIDEDVVDRRLVPRQAWHDVQVRVFGTLAHEVSLRFVSMWNDCSFRTQFLGWPELTLPNLNFTTPQPEGRVLQSLPMWGSDATLHKFEILNAYIQAIERSKSFIYIENQYFVTWSGWQWGERLVENPIGLALVRRVWRAVLEDIQTGQKAPSFFVAIVIPLHPEGSLEDDAVRAVMHFQYSSICRGQESVLGQLNTLMQRYEHINGPTSIAISDYIRFFSLQRVQIDPLTHWPKQTDESRQRLMHRQSFLRFTPGTVLEALSRNAVDEPGTPEVSEKESADTPPQPRGSKKRERARTPYCRVAVSLVYVHSKLLIVDDSMCIIGSANLNDRSMMGNRDAEIAVELRDIPQIKSLREKLWAEFLGIDVTDPVLDNPLAAFRLMISRSKENAKRINKINPGTPTNQRLRTLAAYRTAALDATPTTELQYAAPQGFIVPFPKHFLEGQRLWKNAGVASQFSAFVPHYAYT